ncbi:hypothetical protein M885DRAFT_480801 [Pelagophyceae sp. CCMP2097]|nr:hypothetical protein M885DRAFT_480801 [Pelagophyceae sp. CCMP2097]|mmetsp:Transcript_22507/g.76096  ORF Transcript_22507/g.76096 Transcript_22507/m.76096 type:complete len:594 (-) Transcript_22507:41-1822(-)
MATAAAPRHLDAEFVRRCASVPLRLSPSERRQLAVLVSALRVSEYTDDVDVITRSNKHGRVVGAIKDVCAIVNGLNVCADAGKGKVEDLASNEAFLQNNFEIARRHKISNPSRMRGEYGKLICVLQDAANRGVRDALGFSCHSELRMVSSFLAARGAEDLLWDARLLAATGQDVYGADVADVAARVREKRAAADAVVSAWASESLSEAEVRCVVDSIDDALCHEQSNVAPVDAMLKLLEDSFDSRGKTAEKPVSLSLCPDREPLLTARAAAADRRRLPLFASSLSRSSSSSSAAAAASSATASTSKSADDGGLDASSDGSYARAPPSPRGGLGGAFGSGVFANGGLVNPVAVAVSATRATFGAVTGAVATGLRGLLAVPSTTVKATLQHDHCTQFIYVRQSLLLWRAVQRDMDKLWAAADADLLDSASSYELRNTGQGLHRVQKCPRVAVLMRRLVDGARLESGENWVGLGVVHLGDRDVPNALVFIDKYAQVPRLLSPVSAAVLGIDALVAAEPAVSAYVDRLWGSAKALQMAILADFFKHAFDGDGDDGGSCIDGRLTSAWHWSSNVAKKPYYPILLMAGFQGFDGDFRDD